MREQRERTKFTGVYLRTSETRRNHRDGKPDGCFYITYKTSDGRKVWEKVGLKSEGVTAQQASDLRADRMKSIRHGDALPTRKSRLTMAAAWAIFRDKWLPTLSRPADEEGRYARYIAPDFADRHLDAITPLDLEGLKARLLARGLAPATVRLVFADISRVYRKMTEWSLYTGPIPTTRARPPKMDNVRTRFLSAEDAALLLDALSRRSQQWHDIAALSLHTGMRLGEILSLRGSSVKLQNGTLHAYDAKAGTRAVLISDAVLPLLERLMPDDPAAPLFADRNGQPLTVAGGGNTFSRVVESLGFNRGITDRRQRVVFHTLRHTFCSWLVQKGVPLYTVGELVGHHSVEMTRRYAHLCPDAKRDALQHVGDTLSSAHGPGSPVPRDTEEQPSARSRRVRRP